MVCKIKDKFRGKKTPHAKLTTHSTVSIDGFICEDIDIEVFLSI